MPFVLEWTKALLEVLDGINRDQYQPTPAWIADFQDIVPAIKRIDVDDVPTV